MKRGEELDGEEILSNEQENDHGEGLSEAHEQNRAFLEQLWAYQNGNEQPDQRAQREHGFHWFINKKLKWSNETWLCS